MRPNKELYTQNMTRKEFLQFIILAILGVFGFKNFITFLLENQQKQRHSAQPTKVADKSPSHGFGASKFGA